MTKAELIKALEPLDDDAIIHVAANSIESNGIEYAESVYFDDIVTGDNVMNEITIIGEF